MTQPTGPGLADLRPGDIGFGPIKGGAGLLVGFGQAMLLEGFRVGRLSIRHVFVVTQAQERTEDRETGTGRIYGPECVEAMPSGARRALIRDRWTPDYAYVRLPEDYPGQAEDVAAIARAMIGTPYSFASYAALAAWRLGWKTPRLEAWIDRRREAIKLDNPSIGSPSWYRLPCEAICSVLADQAWSLTGKKIMHGVPHQCVTPGALAGRLLTMPDTTWMWPECAS